jgi:uncharacterized protein with ATP-grasp and redox domains
MRLQLNCLKCLFDRHFQRVFAQPDREKAVEYMQEFCRIVGELEPDAPAPLVAPRMNAVYDRLFGASDKYEKIKKRSNDYVEAKSESISKIIDASQDPILTALKYARVGNYIDYAALGDDVSDETLDGLLDTALSDDIDMDEYRRMVSDLETAKSLVYITDNAGEIVLDRLLIERLMKRFPKLDITVAVRGNPIVNDATREDAAYVGLNRLVRVIDSGSPVAGTYLPDISDWLRELLEGADVIIAKGQGNFETMHGCGLNVYYVFLCKCELFRTMFNVPQLTGMLVNENRV